MKKKIISLLLAVVMIAGMLPLSAITAFASSFAYIEYIDENGVLQSKFMDNVGVITADTRVIGDGWYIVNKDVALPEDANLTVNGNANIILYDDCTLTITPYKIAAPGIALSSGNTLNVFGQQNGSGKIEANAGDESAGIGGAREGSLGTVNIYGGLVYSCGGYRGQGIGGGYWGDPGAVNVYGGYLYAKGGDTYDSIGGTLNVFADQTKNKIMYVRENGNNIAGSPFKTKKEHITITPRTFLEIETVGVDSKYIDRYWDEENKCVVSVEKEIPSGAVSVTSDTTTLSDGWYVVDKNVSIPWGQHLTVTGNAKLILCDGCSLKIMSPGRETPGIDLSSENSDDCSLTIYAQKKGSGKIEAHGGADGYGSAGIGGGERANIGNLNICGGSIKVYGGDNSAGIGGGSGADGGTVNVYGGNIEAYGGYRGAGIGGGYAGAGGTLNFYSGKIEAYGGYYAAGIGGGCYGDKGALNIYDVCSVYAEGGDGNKGINSAITIYPDGAESGAAEIHITGDGKEIAGSPFTEKTVSYLDARTVIVGLTGARWTSATTLPTDSGYYVLENDVTLSKGWNVPVNAEITLDLNGHTISRDLAVHTANGYVICVLGKLTLSDNSKNAAGLVTGGGNNGYGGGILACAGSVVTVSNIAVSDNYATTGGGLMISENATVTLNNCKIINNIAYGAAGIYNSGTLTVNGGCLNENHAITNSGGFYADGGSAEFKDCEIKNNRSDNYGGAFFIDYSSSVTVDGCTVSGNSAKNGGGAFEMERADSKLVLKDSSVTGNSVDVQNSGMSKGGGIHFYLGSVTLKGKMTVKDNTCAGAVNNIFMRGNTVTFDASGLSGDSVVYVNDGVLNDISGITNENVDALVMENGNHIVLNNGKPTSHTPDYTGDCVDNGDGTHSRKCTECEKIGGEAEAHTVTYTSDNNATCTKDGTKSGICELCGAADTVVDIGTKKGHSFTTGVYRDNNDGTHSQKCERCFEYSTPETHTWEVNDFRTHKCTLCDALENHEDGNEDHKCDACEYLICDHNNTVISYNWADNHSSCTAIKHCNDCNNDIETETATKIKLIEDTHGANCQTMGKGHYEATFATLGTAKTEINGSDTWYGDHHYINFVCEYCLDEDWYGAYEKAKADIDRAAGENPTAIVEMLAEYAKDLIYYADYVAEMLEIRDEYVAAIEKLTSGEVHEHTFSTDWNFDETKHWHESTCGHDVISGFAAHTFGEGVVNGNVTEYTCTECGYKKFVYNTAGDNEGEIIDGTSYTGISLTLGSDIAINFYMNLTDEAKEKGTMTFDIGGRIVTGIKVRKNENGYYFSTPLTALEMNETVKATFTYNGVEYVQAYSVAKYIDKIVGNSDTYGEKAAALARKIANYGYYAQIYLESIHTNVTIVEPGEDSNKGYDRMEPFGGEFDIDTQAAIEALAEYSVKVTGASDNLSLYGTTVYFDSATALNYYVTVKNGEKPSATAQNTVTGKSKDVEIKLYKDNIYIVSVKDITATELADDIEVTINGELTITGSVFAYCNSVVKAHNIDGATDKDIFAVNAMAAFYEYYEAACEYAKTQVQE